MGTCGGGVGVDGVMLDSVQYEMQRDICEVSDCSDVVVLSAAVSDALIEVRW